MISSDSDRGSFLYFDVGEPIWTNIHTAPSNFAPPIRRNSVVVLSHWDTDHYAYGRQNKNFHDNCWIAPAQRSVGPNAFKFALQLDQLHRLILVGAGENLRYQTRARIIRCLGNSINGSGLALHLEAKGREILLTGDADYHEIPGIQAMSLSGLQIPHHGGTQSKNSTIPSAGTTSARAVASCGRPNRYGHPNAATLQALRNANWTVETTASAFGSPRGSRLL